MRKIIGATIRNHPSIVADIKQHADISGFNQDLLRIVHPQGAVVLDISSGAITRSMLSFGAKLGMALHYEVTDIIIPSTGFILPTWYSNYSLVMGELPNDLASILSPAQTLRQGKKHVADQFTYASAWERTGRASVHRARFGDRYIIDVIVGAHASDFSELSPEAPIYRPGFMKGADAPPC